MCDCSKYATPKNCPSADVSSRSLNDCSDAKSAGQVVAQDLYAYFKQTQPLATHLTKEKCMGAGRKRNTVDTKENDIWIRDTILRLTQETLNDIFCGEKGKKAHICGK